jgi:hypothetical protein
MYAIHRHDRRPDIPRAGFPRTPQKPQHIRIHYEIWKKTPPDVQHTIIEYNKSIKHPSGNPSTHQVNFHTTRDPVGTTDEYSDQDHLDETSTPLLDYATFPRADQMDIRSVLSMHKAASKQTSAEKDLTPQPRETHKTTSRQSRLVDIDGKTYEINYPKYHVSAHQMDKSKHALVDRGANGGLAGGDVRIIEKVPNRMVDITGIDNHEITNLPLVTAAAVVDTVSHEPMVVIMHQYAYTGKGKTIHPSGQLVHYKNHVDDKSKLAVGKLRIVTKEGYTLPLLMTNGLPYIAMRPPTDAELDEDTGLPQIILTSDEPWDPSVLDHDYSRRERNKQAVSQEDPLGTGHYLDRRFDETGMYNHRVVAHMRVLTGSTDLKFDHHVVTNNETNTVPTNPCVECSETTNPQFSLHSHQSKPTKPNLDDLRSKFGWAPTDIIAPTLSATTQFARQIIRTNGVRQNFWSRFPALNVRGRQDAAPTASIYFDTPAIDDGSTNAQLFVGHKLLIADVYGMKSDKEFVNTLEDPICSRGAMDSLLSDRAQVEISKKVQDALRAYRISDWQSEPLHQHQNPCETRYRTIKEYTNNILNRTGAPAYCWLLCLVCVCFLLNHMASAVLKYRTPLEVCTGITPDISALLEYTFYQSVYYLSADNHFPPSSNENIGHFVVTADSIGDALKDPNLRASPSVGESKPIIFVRGAHHDEQYTRTTQLPSFDPDDLIGRTFLWPMGNGEHHRATIIRKVIDNSDGNDMEVKFLLKIDDGRVDEIVTHNDIIQYLENQEEDDFCGTNPNDCGFKFRRIIAQQGPLKPRDKDYKGSSYNVLVEFESGETAHHPFDTMVTDDPKLCVVYAKENNLLSTPGWKQFKRITKNAKKMLRMANQSKLRQERHCPIYKFGYQVPRNHKEPMDLDIQNDDTKGCEAEQLEHNQIDEYEVFQAVVKGSTGSHYTLTKRHNTLAFQRVREAIASGMFSFIHIGGKTNPADALSKYWGFASVWPVLKPLLYWKGNTQECPDGIEIFPPTYVTKGSVTQ